MFEALVIAVFTGVIGGLVGWLIPFQGRWSLLPAATLLAAVIVEQLTTRGSTAYYVSNWLEMVSFVAMLSSLIHFVLGKRP